MSLPSIRAIAGEMRIDLTKLSQDQTEKLLVEAMRRDLPLATMYLLNMTDKAGGTGERQVGSEDPNSPLGKQLTRIFAGTVLRELAQKHFCRGHELAFLNCCGVVVDKKRPPLQELMGLQVAMQDGTLASADC